MTSLYVAAGGGGDALAAAIVHRALGHDSPAIIVTYAWDRLAIDPLPGPRSAADFTGLEPLGRHNHVITSTTKPRPPSGSTLPRVARDLDDTLVLLDPTHGAVGMHAQLAELVDIHQPEAVTVLDVGGDALARGDEPELRSPLADALSLAAATDLDVPVTVLVAGAGLDGELSERQVLDITGTEAAYGLTAADVDPFRPVLDWHPSEATALLAAAACGLRGTVEVRDSGLTVELTDTSASIYRLALSDVLDINALAVALTDTTALNQAEDITRYHCGFSEIDYERAKQKSATPVDRHLNVLALDAAVHNFERDAARRGVRYVTFRRIAEAVRPIQVDTAEIRGHLITSRPDRYRWPLWSLWSLDERPQRALHAKAG